jgi:hypothetical protein
MTDKQQIGAFIAILVIAGFVATLACRHLPEPTSPEATRTIVGFGNSVSDIELAPSKLAFLSLANDLAPTTVDVFTFRAEAEHRGQVEAYSSKDLKGVLNQVQPGPPKERTNPTQVLSLIQQRIAAGEFKTAKRIPVLLYWDGEIFNNGDAFVKSLKELLKDPRVLVGFFSLADRAVSKKPQTDPQKSKTDPQRERLREELERLLLKAKLPRERIITGGCADRANATDLFVRQMGVIR